MRAITYSDYGEPDVLTLTERENPQASGEELLIRVHVAGVNPIDARLRDGEMRGLLPGGFPRIPGYDVAGVVERGDRDGRFSEGTRVLGFLDHVYGGGYAELAACGADAAVAIPDEMSFEEAGGLPLAGSTALQSLVDHGHLESGETVLVNGASGGVGCLAVQVAAAKGATVTGVCSEKSVAFVREMGATETIDYRTTEFEKLNRKWDLIFDAAGKSSYAACRNVLAEDGRYVSTEPNVRGLVMSAITQPLAKAGVLKNSGTIMLAKTRSEDLRELVALYEAGKLKVPIEATYPLEHASTAHRRLKEGNIQGKIVLKVTG